MKAIAIIFTLILGASFTQDLKADPPGIRDNHNHHNHFRLPHSVVASLSHRYHQFDLIHTRRTHRKGRLSYELLIQQGSRFVSVSINHRGRISGDAHYRHYPLGNHYCDHSCSFQYQHFNNGRFVSYDPYVGCTTHVHLLANKHPRYRYQPYHGYGKVHHQKHRHRSDQSRYQKGYNRRNG